MKQENNTIIILAAKADSLRLRMLTNARNLKNTFKTPQNHILNSYLDPTKKFTLPISLMFVIFLISSRLVSPQSNFELAKKKLIQNPNDVQSHIVLAETFLQNNQIKEAEKELVEINRLKKSQNLKKETNSKIENLWQKKAQVNPQDIKWLVSRWEFFLEQNPDYRDGYLHLSLLYYRLNSPQEAKINLAKAIEIDPNYEPLKKINNIID